MTLGGTDATAHVLRAFLQDWAASLKASEVRRIERSVANAAVALHEDLGALIPRQLAAGRPTIIRNAESRHGYLAHTLRALLAESDRTTKLLDEMAPTEMAALRACLTPQEIASGQLLSILSALVPLVEAPGRPLAEVLTRAVRRLRRRVQSHGRFDSGVLLAVAETHVRALLRDHPPAALEHWAERRLATGAFRAVTEARFATWRRDRSLNARMTAATRRFCAALLDAATVLPLPEGHRPFRVWYGLVWHLRRALLDDDVEGAARKLALVLARHQAYRRVWWYTVPFLETPEPARRRVWEAVDRIERPLAARLVADGDIAATPHGPPLGGLLGRGIREAVVERVARAVALRHDVAEPSFRSDVQQWIVGLRAARPSEMELERYADVATTMRVHHEQLRALVEGATPRIESLTLEALRGGARSTTRWWSNEDLWRIWRKKTLDEARDDRHAWAGFVWDGLRGRRLQTALEPLGAPPGRLREFDVVFPLQGVRDLDDGFEAADITWYNPSARTFDDSAGFAAQPMEVHVHMRVRAASAALARARALARLEPALSTLVFALSASERVTGFRPTSTWWTFIGDRSRGAGGCSWGRSREEMADAATGTVLARFAGIYAQVVCTPQHRRSAAARSFLRAAFWYRSGRWQPDPVRRFLDHYVALEHLLVQGGHNKDAEVARAGSLILGGWRHRGFVFARSLDQVVERARRLSRGVASLPPDAPIVVAAEAAAVAMPHGRDWRTSLLPWLSPTFLRSLAAAAPVEVTSPDWEAHLASIERLAAEERAWAGFDQARVKDVEFRLRLLARRRHEIVHEAMTTAPGMDLEARALTDMVEEILGLLAEALLDDPAGTTDLPSWLASHHPPWS